MNIFARKIHFYYRHREWADAIFDRLNGDDEGEIWAARRAVGEIVYKDGTVVRFIPATSQARGYRCNLAYIEASYVGGLDWIFCSTIVMPKMLGEWRNTGPGQVYALSDVKALMRDPDSTGFCIPAKEYFRAQEDMIDKVVKAIDDRVIKECEIANVNDELDTKVKIAELENFSSSAQLDDDCADEESIDKTLNDIKKKRPSYTFFHGSLEELEKKAKNGDIAQLDEYGIWWLKRVEDDCK